MVSWEEASQEVINMAEELIAKYHPVLGKYARVGFVFRSEAQVSNGRAVLGKASKVSEKLKTLLELDFLIWIAKKEFEAMEDERKRALIDHELSHCSITDGDFRMRHHDVEEFHAIIERYGLWTDDLQRTKAAIDKAEQLHFDELARGLVKALDGATLEKVGKSLE